jgi:hypothetical protein
MGFPFALFRGPLVLGLAALCASCVTSADLRAVSDELYKIEQVALDGTRTDQDLLAQIHSASEAIEDVAEEVEERTESVIGGLTDGQAGGIAGILAALGVHFYRNTTRRKQLADIQRES